MTGKHYSSDEAANRLLRILKAEVPTSEIPGSLIGELFGWDTALSDIIHLFAGTLAGETLTFPDAAFGDITGDGIVTVSGTVTAEDLLIRDDVFVQDDIFGGDDVTISGTLTARNVAVGGVLSAALLGNGDIVIGMMPAATRPTGTLSNLGGVLFVENGNLMYLGSSGTVSTVAGS